MTHRDPIESLSRYYAHAGSLADSGLAMDSLLAKKEARARGRLAGALAFGAGAAAAALFLTWASKPLPINQSGAAAIARSQMIQSGLVRREGSGWVIR